ncbi:VOC family protein [Undibacterium sp. Dicai25W]|uniref:VOC family protein n=1 Tax=Undibacterium sp. Dicai25W TaxID=3413034 RepID=UPI003BEF67A4
MPLSMNRLILYVRDVSLLKRFYQKHFSFDLVEEISDEWVVLNTGRIELAFHRVGMPWRDLPLSRSSSNVKMVFIVKSGLPELRASLLSAGVVMGGIKRYDGFSQLMCDGEDPEGNVFQLSQPD